MQPDLKQIIEIASQSCETIFRESGEILPMWHTINAAGDHGIWAMPMYDKDAVAEGMRKFFVEKHVVAYVFMTEAWTVINVAGLQHAVDWVNSGKSLKTYPGRHEVLMFLAEDGDKVFTAQRKIIRNRGRPKLGPLEWLDEVASRNSIGRFVGLLPRKAETAH